jgi:hypothetical protein
MNVANEWFHLAAVLILGFLVHRMEKRLDVLETVQLDVAKIKGRLGIE